VDNLVTIILCGYDDTNRFITILVALRRCSSPTEFAPKGPDLVGQAHH